MTAKTSKKPAPQATRKPAFNVIRSLAAHKAHVTRLEVKAEKSKGATRKALMNTLDQVRGRMVDFMHDHKRELMNASK